MTEKSPAEQMLEDVRVNHPDLTPQDGDDFQSYIERCAKWLKARGYDETDSSKLPHVSHMALALFAFRAAFGFEFPFTNAGVSKDDDGEIVPVVALSADNIEEIMGRAFRESFETDVLNSVDMVVVHVSDDANL